jgi:hypothetical protein
MSLVEYFSTGPPHERPVAEVVLAHLRSLGPVTIEPVSVGILVKHGSAAIRSRTFVELRPMTKWEAVSFVLPRRVEHPRIARTMRATGALTAHVVNVRTPDEVDDTLFGWLTEAYASTQG